MALTADASSTRPSPRRPTWATAPRARPLPRVRPPRPSKEHSDDRHRRRPGSGRDPHLALPPLLRPRAAGGVDQVPHAALDRVDARDHRRRHGGDRPDVRGAHVVLADDPELAAGSGGLMPGVMIVTFGYSFAQLVVAVLGALTITGEYSTGMIRSTFSAVPTRLPAFAAKSIVLAVVTFVVSALGVVASYLVALPFLSGTSLEVDLGAEGTMRAFIGTPLYLAAIAVLSVALGAIIRNSAGTIFGLVALLLVVPSILQAIPTDWVRDLAQFLPSTAGERLVIGDAMNGMGTEFILGPWQGFAVLVGWVVVAWAVAAVVLKRRDA
nr:ABC transporter permease [Cellulosimicrobium sp. CUA-896]